MTQYNKPVKTKCWENFLKSQGCSYNSTRASHDKWKCPNCLRSIIFRGAEKEIPRFHIQTNLRTMGISMSDFNDWEAANC